MLPSSTHLRTTYLPLVKVGDILLLQAKHAHNVLTHILLLEKNGNLVDVLDIIDVDDVVVLHITEQGQLLLGLLGNDHPIHFSYALNGIRRTADHKIRNQTNATKVLDGVLSGLGLVLSRDQTP